MSLKYLRTLVCLSLALMRAQLKTQMLLNCSPLFDLQTFCQDFTKESSQSDSEGEEDEEDESNQDDDAGGMPVQGLGESLQNVAKLSEEFPPVGKPPHNEAPQLFSTEDDNCADEKILGDMQPANGTTDIVSKSQSGSTKKKVNTCK